MKDILRHLRVALPLFLGLSLLSGAAYPLAVSGLAQALFPRQAQGSLIKDGGRLRGSSLIGQPFSDPRYFWGRLSATSPKPYDAASSGGSNLATTNPALLEAAQQRLDALRAADPQNQAPVPLELLTSSGSGLDPHISPAAALYQAARVAQARGLTQAKVREMIASHTQDRQLGFLGEPRVNVLELNLALDALAGGPVQ